VTPRRYEVVIAREQTAVVYVSAESVSDAEDLALNLDLEPEWDSDIARVLQVTETGYEG
jgi:hypothetical protein